MTASFDLVLAADADSFTAELRLLDEHGRQLGYRGVDFKAFPLSRLQALFELRRYFDLYAEPEEERAEVEKLGVVLAEEVLGAEIFAHLWRPESHRTLQVRLPGAGEDDPLVAALARLPWEIARPRVEAESLFERNLVVRVVHDTAPPASAPLDPEEEIRVLFVFAEARGSSPLGVRRERRELQRLLRREVYPHRRVVAHFLVHGVTRERLEEQIEDHGGYHLVHWSGHGRADGLELARPGGKSDVISGRRLLDLFSKAGGLPPRLAFLSACHSGEVLTVAGWDDLEAAAQGHEPARRAAGEAKRDLDLTEAPGFTGTAHAFLQAGVPAVVAMRDVVGDEYARELALDFYRSVLAAPRPKTVAVALNQARKALFARDGARFFAADPAMPVLYGAEDARLPLPSGRSSALDGRERRLHTLAELTLSSHEHFVGRTWELDGLGAEFIGAKASAAVKPVAVLTGLGGMGKTALVAEVLDLWEERFEWVATYQAKPNALGFDGFLRDLDWRLRGELGRYYQHVQSRPADTIYRDATADFTGKERQGRLIRNLLRALRDEPILLVFDNFETNLKPTAEKEPVDGQPVWQCQDPVWDALLSALASGLAGSGSRVLVTSRRLPVTLAGGSAHRVPLGPLPPGEAGLYLREHPTLREMFFGADEQRRLAHRLLEASRFHPLLMDRMARLAARPPLRPQLLEALEALEKTNDFEKLPALFATERGDAVEIAYLEDALTASIDQLIASAGPDARRLLWTIAVANEPVALGLVRAVWSGESHQTQVLRHIRRMLDFSAQLSEEIRTQVENALAELPPEVRSSLNSLPPPPEVPDLEPLLQHLVGLGLVTEERADPEDENPDLSCHELVRERAWTWLEEKSEEQAASTETSVRLAYAERLEADFKTLQHQNMTLALQAGSRALVYYAQVEAWDRMGSFAGQVVTSTRDLRLLEGLLPHLRTAAESAPQGPPRWRCLGHLADALRNGGGPDASLPFFEQATAQARTAVEAGGEWAQQAWPDLAWISGNWAHALGDLGHLDTARERLLEAVHAFQEAGSPAIYRLGSELEALRIDIQQGQVGKALPKVEEHLERVAGWWRQHGAGQPVPEAPNAEFLARVYLGALDIAKQADLVQNRWESALDRIETMLEVVRTLERPATDIAVVRMNRANTLVEIPGRLGEARAELEACLEIFRNDPAESARALSSLADLFDRQGDVVQAIAQERRALALREKLPDPKDRVTSHNNLAIYLEQGTPAALAEAPRHQLAALVYGLAAGLDQQLKDSHNYAIVFRRAHADGTEPSIPRLSELLADPAFDPLQSWLAQRQVNLAVLQAAVDEWLEQVRQAVIFEEGLD